MTGKTTVFSPQTGDVALPLDAQGNMSGNITITGGSISGAVLHGAPDFFSAGVSATSAAVGPAVSLPVPQGGMIVSLKFYTETPFTGATVSGGVGSASGDASYVSEATVKNGGVVDLLDDVTAAGAGVLLSAPASGGMVFNLYQGTPTSVGSGVIVGGYVIS